MNFNKHSELIGQHAFLGASKYHWFNYDEDKVPAYELPPLLKLADGKTVQDVKTWEKKRCPELLKLFEENNVTQSNIAEKLGTTRQTIGNWLLGKSQPDFDTLVKLADYFETTTDYLLGRTDSKSASPDLRLAVDYTNLSQRAVQFLHTHVLNRDNLIDFFHLLMGEFIHE